MSMPECLFSQDLEGLTKVFDRMCAGMSAPIWADFSFLSNGFEKKKDRYLGVVLPHLLGENFQDHS